MKLPYFFLLIILSPLCVVAESLHLGKEEENRAQSLFDSIKCPVCEGQSIKDSQTELAEVLRDYVRSNISSGKTNDEIIDELRKTYGDSISFQPKLSAHTIVLWALPILTFFFCLIYLIRLLKIQLS
jgi:cytochrome c-type biogenesis protein CcmH